MLLKLMSTEALVAELARRGVQTADPDRVDAEDVLMKLGSLAGEALPAALDLVRDLRIENAKLEARAAKSESQVSVLAAAIVTDEISSLESRATAVAVHNESDEE
jgi:hypothetical protein